MKKVLSLVLSVVMVMSVLFGLNLTAFASDGDAIAISIDFTPVSAPVIYENTGGNWQQDDYYDDYYSYDINPIFFKVGNKITVNYSDDTVDEFTYSETELGSYYKDAKGNTIDANYTHNQYSNHWKLGSDNYFNAIVNDVIQPIRVTITENPVKSILFTPISQIEIISEAEGTGEGKWDEQGEEYFNYYTDNLVISDGNSIVVNYKDGTNKKFVCDNSVYKSTDGNTIAIKCTDTQNENHWKIGSDNLFTVSYMGAEQKVPVIILKNTNCAHKWIKKDTVKQTCTTNGYTYYQCSVCGDTIKRDIVVATGHSAEEWIIDTEPTCTNTGRKHRICSACKTILNSVSIPAKGHSFDQGVVEKTPSCSEEGTKKYTCTECQETKTESIAKMPHNYGDWIVDTPATCTANGSQHRECPNCGDIDSQVIPATGHNWDDGTVEKAPSCTEKGIKKYTCTKCSETRTEDIEKLPHSYGDWIVDTPATCTANGSQHRECPNCDDVDSQVIPATGHNWDDGTVEKAPSCTEKGIKKYTCTKCGETRTEDIEKLEHTYGDWIVDTAATCTANGSQHKECANCGDTVSETILATGHAYGDWIVDIPSTCTANGSQHKKCANCGDSVSETILATGHTSVIDRAVAPTCTTSGLTEGSHCSVCNQVIINQQPIAPKGHTSSDWIVDKNATCTSGGSRHKECINCCETTETEVLKPTGHKNVTTFTAATFTADGNRTTKCSVCKKTLSTTRYYKASYAKLSTTNYTYNGKTHTPSVTVKNSKGTVLKRNTDYTLSYSSGRKSVGKYSIKITLKGNYKGTKTLYYYIVPKSTTISSLSAGKKQFTVKWKKQSSQTTGYQIQYSTSSKFKSPKTVTVGSNKTTSKTIKKLSGKKKYYVRIRTYKTVKISGKSTKIYSSWSKSKYVTTKK